MEGLQVLTIDIDQFYCVRCISLTDYSAHDNSYTRIRLRYNNNYIIIPNSITNMVQLRSINMYNILPLYLPINFTNFIKIQSILFMKLGDTNYYLDSSSSIILGNSMYKVRDKIIKYNISQKNIY